MKNAARTQVCEVHVCVFANVGQNKRGNQVISQIFRKFIVLFQIVNGGEHFISNCSVGASQKRYHVRRAVLSEFVNYFVLCGKGHVTNTGRTVVNICST